MLTHAARVAASAPVARLPDLPYRRPRHHVPAAGAPDQPCQKRGREIRVAARRLRPRRVRRLPFHTRHDRRMRSDVHVLAVPRLTEIRPGAHQRRHAGVNPVRAVPRMLRVQPPHERRPVLTGRATTEDLLHDRGRRRIGLEASVRRAQIPVDRCRADMDATLHGVRPRRRPVLPDHPELPLRERQHHVPHEPPGRRRRVDPQVLDDQLSARLVEPLDRAQRIRERTSEPVEPRHDDPVRLARLHTLEGALEPLALIPGAWGVKLLYDVDDRCGRALPRTAAPVRAGRWGR